MASSKRQPDGPTRVSPTGSRLPIHRWCPCHADAGAVVNCGGCSVREVLPFSMQRPRVEKLLFPSRCQSGGGEGIAVVPRFSSFRP
jgi:hypothetical protein